MKFNSCLKIGYKELRGNLTLEEIKSLLTILDKMTPEKETDEIHLDINSIVHEDDDANF